MDFLFFAAQYPPTVGGVERYTQSLASTLVAMGHSATVVTSLLPGLPADETTPDGVRVLRLPAFLPMKGRFPVLRKNAEFAETAGKIWQQNHTLAVINTRFYPLSLWAAKQTARHGMPAIVIEHGTKHLSLDNALLDVAANAYEHAAMKLVRRHCGRIYGVSRAGAEWLRHFGITADGVLYNAVDPQALELAANRGEEASALVKGLRGLAGPTEKENTPLVTFSGRFIREKGVYELLQGFALLRRRLPNARLVMAGDGPEREKITAMAPEGVVLPGQLGYEENLALLRRSHVFCLPTYSEGFSATVLEAAALKTFTVTTPTGGSPELIQNGVSGTLLANLQPQTIADALEKPLMDENFRKTAAQAACNTLCQNFTWRRTAQALINIAQTAKEAHP